MKRLTYLIPVLCFAVLSAGLGYSLTNDLRKLPSMLIDKPTPPFRLATLIDNGDEFSSDDLKGRIVLLNIFASWCPGCRVEHPTLMTLTANHGVPIYGINWKDRPGDGARWLRANRNPYVRVGDDRDGRLGIDLGVTGVPETFVIDQGGRIRYRHAGPITDLVWHDAFMPLIASLRAER
jgi:cytochrome c biogenesis protein CcmG/thiol:disulfide interchange protein DsbE